MEVSNWTWDHEARAYFWHRFFSHQPDLNYDNPEVHKAIFKVVDFWLDLGVDGLRLDAVPYLYEREGTNCENLPETHAFLKKLRAHVDEKYGDRMLLAEANQWPEDAVTYFGQGRGDECHMAFHFPLMPRLFMALRMEDRLPIVDILEQTPPIPETSQWALFLRNHDELTLEMVTDEERDYMYRMYAQVHQARLNLGIRRRLAPLLNNDRKSIELLNALLFSLPGTPVLYYGDEIGLGENIYLGDRNGVRTPMQWSSDKNAGFSRANPQSLYLPIILDPSLPLRSRQRGGATGQSAFAALVDAPDARAAQTLARARRGQMRISPAGQPQNLELRPAPRTGNHSGGGQSLALHPAGGTGFVGVQKPGARRAVWPDEISRHHGRAVFSHARPAQFLLVLARTQAAAAGGASRKPARPRRCRPSPSPKTGRRFSPASARAKFEALLPDYLRSRPWFSGQSRNHQTGDAQGMFSTCRCRTKPPPRWRLLQVEYVDANPELFALPLAFAAGDAAAGPVRENAIAALTLPEDAAIRRGLRSLCRPGVRPGAARIDPPPRAAPQRTGRGGSHRACRRLRQILNGTTRRRSRPFTTRTKATPRLIFGDQIVLKFFRRLGPGVNPELEIGRFLTEKNFPHSPTLLGALEYHADADAPMTLAVAKAFVPHAKNGWKFTLDAISRYYDRVFADAAQGHNPSATPAVGPLKPVHHHPPAEAAEHVGTYLESARLLGERTAELHLALASGEEGGEFVHGADDAALPARHVPVHALRWRCKICGCCASRSNPCRRNWRRSPSGWPTWKPRFSSVTTGSSNKTSRPGASASTATCIWARCSGRDAILSFWILKAMRPMPISERRIKRSPLRDVARMLRSFHHAAYAGFHQQVELGVIARENLTRFEPWVRHWNVTVSRAYLQAYFRGLEKSEMLPRDEEKLRVMLLAYLLNQVMDELGRELRAAFRQRPRAVAGHHFFDGGTAAVARLRAARRHSERSAAGSVKFL